jgi:hypothetical protein
MFWQPPRRPGRSDEERIEYWKTILQIPDGELGAMHLRIMASQRLNELDLARSRQNTPDLDGA